MAEVKPAGNPEMKGWLHKWTNYLKGYQKRWFVLANGVLSYYRNPTEMTHTCRGSIRLQGALIHAEESCHFVISNAGTNTFHLKAANEAERQMWITAIELGKAKAIRQQDLEDEEEFDVNHADGDWQDVNEVVKSLNAKLGDLQICGDLISKHFTALQRSITDAEAAAANPTENPQEFLTKVKAVNERSTLFRLTSGAVIKAATDFVTMAQTNGRKWQKLLTYEHEQRMRLQDMVETLARQHSNLENAAKAQSGHSKLPSSSTGASAHSDDDENEFYDAQDETEFVVQVPLGHRRTSSGVSTISQASEGRGVGGENDGGSSSDNDDGDTTISVIARRNKSPSESVKDTPVPNGSASAAESPKKAVVSRRRRRSRIPEKPDYPLNLWSIMRNCIGKELTKIPMPVNFSEPLSMLQRLVEDYEYSEILDKAAQCTDSCEQMAYVAAFTVSSYATTSVRTAKPFNPMLGETYEWDRTDDLGWKVVSEQVSHHPPMVAQHCESKHWVCYQEFTMTSTFRGKYLQVKPLGISHLKFHASGNHYTWRKVTTNVNNIVIGKLWVDHHGDMEILNHKTGEKCALNFVPYSYFSSDVQRKVTGAVMNRAGEMTWVLNGTWDVKMEAAKVAEKRGTAKGKQVLETEPPKVVWQRRFPPPDADKYYNFSEFACQLNETEEGVAPTDSRLRPDQRLMEEGDWDGANDAKVRLEEKQRTVRKAREQESEIASQEGRPVKQLEPLWFTKEKDTVTGGVIHIYKGQYWESKEKHDWSVCPDIF